MYQIGFTRLSDMSGEPKMNQPCQNITLVDSDMCFDFLWNVYALMLYLHKTDLEKVVGAVVFHKEKHAEVKF